MGCSVLLVLSSLAAGLAFNKQLAGLRNMTGSKPVVPQDAVYAKTQVADQCIVASDGAGTAPVRLGACDAAGARGYAPVGDLLGTTTGQVLVESSTARCLGMTDSGEVVSVAERECRFGNPNALWDFGVGGVGGSLVRNKGTGRCLTATEGLLFGGECRAGDSAQRVAQLVPVEAPAVDPAL